VAPVAPVVPVAPVAKLLRVPWPIAGCNLVCDLTVCELGWLRYLGFRYLGLGT